MHNAINEGLCVRMEEIIHSLADSNTRYALENDICSRLYASIEAIISPGGDISICSGDRANLRDFIDHISARDSIIQEALYRQGYLDCVTLLSALNII